jgi:GAF domain-containing protein
MAKLYAMPAGKRRRGLHGELGDAQDRADGPRGLADLAALAAERSEETIERAIAIAGEVLEMEIAYVSEFSGDNQIYRGLRSDEATIPFDENEDTISIPLEGSYCRRMTLGEIPNVINDAKHDERVKDLEITRLADVGAYIGVPLQFSDGTLYGTICCASHNAREELGERDVKFMQVLARIVAGELEQRALEAENRRLRVQVRELQLEIDQARKAEQVAEITETDYFRGLRERADELRGRGPPGSGQ